jgi:cytochrome c-type biogenesis protein CcmE
MSKGVQIAVGAILVVILLGWFGWSQVEEGALVYYTNLEELRASGEMNSGARVHGFVVEGSIERDVSAKVVRFHVRSTQESTGRAGEDALPVVYSSLETPDLFKDGAEVVVEGRLVGSGRGTFEATHILAKCPSKFEAKDSGQAAL